MRQLVGLGQREALHLAAGVPMPAVLVVDEDRDLAADLVLGLQGPPREQFPSRVELNDSAAAMARIFEQVDFVVAATNPAVAFAAEGCCLTSSTASRSIPATTGPHDSAEHLRQSGDLDPGRDEPGHTCGDAGARPAFLRGASPGSRPRCRERAAVDVGGRRGPT